MFNADGQDNQLDNSLENDTKGTVFEDSFSEEVWNSTYKHYTDNDINDTLYRVAQAAASVEETDEKANYWTGQFYDLLTDFKGTVGGRIYANAGTEWAGTTLMNCYVSPRPNFDIDSLDGILADLRNQAQTLKSEGGWGQNFSFIRPRGAFIHGNGVETPGAVKYMELYDRSSDVITSGSGKQNNNKKAKNKIRKGAMMGVLDVWHPDIVEFVTAKQQQGRLTKFNVSVNCTDEFMDKVERVKQLKQQGASEEEIEQADSWDLRFPDTSHSSYKDEWDGDLKNWMDKGFPVEVYETISATWLWDLIMESTYNRAEPGVLFLDRANHFNPLNYKETIKATNPCGEQTLAPGGVCDLGSLNLTQFVDMVRRTIDFEKLKHYTPILVRLLDNINTLSNAPLDEYIYSMRNKRRIGCGILGWGSALYMMKTRFGSEQAHELRDQLMSTFAKEAYKASIDLAEEKGMFSECEPEKHVENAFVQNLDLPQEYLDKMKKVGIRNSSLLSIQPTGNTAILANVASGGLEPVFMHEYVRTVIVDSMPEHIEDVTPKWYAGEWYETSMFKETTEGDETILRGVDDFGTVYKIDQNRGLTKEVLCEDYGVRKMKELGEWDPNAEWAATTLDLEVDDHLNDLKGFARWIDSAVSKTINVPNDYSFDGFKDIYQNAYQSGSVKGVTTYRAGTMTTVLSAKEEKTADQKDEEIILEDVKLPDSAPATVKTLRAEQKKWYITVVSWEQANRPFAIFVQTNAKDKNIQTNNALEVLFGLAQNKGIPQRHINDVEEKINADNNAEKIARTISLLLRHGVLIKNIVGALDNVNEVYVGSFLFQIKKYLSTYIKDGEQVEDEKCPDCNSQMVFQEGCRVCLNCSNSKCG